MYIAVRSIELQSKDTHPSLPVIEVDQIIIIIFSNSLVKHELTLNKK